MTLSVFKTVRIHKNEGKAVPALLDGQTHYVVARFLKDADKAMIARQFTDLVVNLDMPGFACYEDREIRLAPADCRKRGGIDAARAQVQARLDGTRISAAKAFFARLRR